MKYAGPERPSQDGFYLETSGNALAVWIQFDGTRNSIWSNRFE